MRKYDIALIGLGVMGSSLARNLASRKINTLVYNRHTEKAESFIEKYGNPHLDFRKNLKTLVADLKSPRVIILMVPAGKPVDEMIRQLTPLLSKNDIVIDGGNSFYKDTIAREAALRKKGIRFIGLGVSGGEEGALNGPSLMPGCDAATWKHIRPILEKIAARDFAGKPTVTHIGTDGAGHYVKMVHNGIEYAMMQLMAEAYHLLKSVYGLSAPEIADVFARYNKGKLKSYLFEISAPVLKQKNDLGKGFLINFILDTAGQKGTGAWTVLDAVERGIAVPTIVEAVFARSVSAAKSERVQLSHHYPIRQNKPTIPLARFTKILEDALYAAMISCYAQGFDLIRQAAAEQKWAIRFSEIARIWEGGCIIRADLLNVLHKAFVQSKDKPVHLFSIKPIVDALKRDVPALETVAGLACQHGIPAPGLSTALAYFLSMTSATLSANLIQGLRDFFGAHTYERTDRKGVFHTEWK